MKYLAALTLVPPVIGVIDAFLFMKPNCITNANPEGGFGSYLRCYGLRPNTCCGIDTLDSPFQSVAIRGVMDGYAARLSGYDGGNCTKRRVRADNRGSSIICIPNLGLGYNYTGCDYTSGFSKKDSKNGKVGCQRPDVLVLPDGTEYDLSQLSDDSFKELIDISVQAKDVSDVPSKFQVL